MNYLYLAFFIGLFGSLHCVAMCGPLVLMVAGGKQSTFSWFQIVHSILYHLGRITIYGWIGLIFGGVISSIDFKGWQQVVSITTGVILLLIAFSNLFRTNLSLLMKVQNKILQPFIRFMGKLIHRPSGAFFAGALNGILPCGMVYMALASAINADGMFHSALFMIFFGLGTLPLMLIFSVFSTISARFFKIRFSKVLISLYLVMGCWFILRGANLDIPYLSTVLYPQGAIHCK